MLLKLLRDLRDTKRTYLIMEILAQHPELGINVFKYEQLIRDNLDLSNVSIGHLVLVAHREDQKVDLLEQAEVIKKACQKVREAT